MMLLTYGHGTEAADRTAALLRGAGILSLVDIRTVPDREILQCEQYPMRCF